MDLSAAAIALADPEAVLSAVELSRVDATRKLDASRRSELGQFLTPQPIARFMASLFADWPAEVRLLDAGAGVGSLTVAAVVAACEQPSRPRSIHVTAYEIDEALAVRLKENLAQCSAFCRGLGVAFSFDVHREDFIRVGSAQAEGGLFVPKRRGFNRAILNPPYRKIRSASEERQALRAAGVETSNLYAAFLSLAVKLLDPGGELVAITPRSFCNGPYFRPFRAAFLDAMALRRVHVFDSRRQAFRDDEVLQENVIVHAAKDRQGTAPIIVSTSDGPEDGLVSVRRVPPREVVRDDDAERFIHIVTDDLGGAIAARMGRFTASLADLGVEASTGRVVDFRAIESLRQDPGKNTVPLIYPTHLAQGSVVWPKGGKKPNAIVASTATASLLLPAGFYVLVKRFSAKEERRRIVASVYDPAVVPGEQVGFENHLNVYHRSGAGLPECLARGLAVFLNSSLVDAFFRQFNGHTQVNATDLRKLRYPPREALERVGSRLGASFPTQDEIDQLVATEFFDVTKKDESDPVAAKRKIDEALAVLGALGLPREQQNERSALTLLALLDLRPTTPWVGATNPLRGITPMMTFFADEYGKTYAPNTRETVRRFTVHQFVDAGLILENPDKPDRPTNSPKAVYQVEKSALELLQQYGTPTWDKALASYLEAVGTLRKRYAQEREMSRLPVTLMEGASITLSPGGQNELVKQIIEEFCPRFTPGGRAIYVGDTSDKWAYFDKQALAKLGVEVDAHGKMPDIVVHHVEKNWLLLIEAVTSHGPVNAKRREELAELFGKSSAGLVYVTTFLTRKAMVRYLDEISWETEVWVAEAPSHMIHFNGERFLGPYATESAKGS